MKATPIAPAHQTLDLRLPARPRLIPRSTYPRPARVALHPGPLRRLAWVFGFQL